MTEPAETYRAALWARRPPETGGGACTLLVRRVGGRVQLLFHAVLPTGAELTDEQALELARYLTEAVRGRREPPSVP
jgi:hypothetical protein